MTDTAILYRRTAVTPRDVGTYPDLIDELSDDNYIDAADKIFFTTKIRQFEGFERRYDNKIRTVSHINSKGQISQQSKHYGMDGLDIDIFGNFKDKADISKLISFEETYQTPAEYPDGIIGLYVINYDFLNKDPDKTAKKGYLLMGSVTGHVGSKSTIWDFRTTLRFGGVLKSAS